MSHSTHSRFSELKRRRRGKTKRQTPRYPQSSVQEIGNKPELRGERDTSINKQTQGLAYTLSGQNT